MNIAFSLSTVRQQSEVKIIMDGTNISHLHKMKFVFINHAEVRKPFSNFFLFQNN